MCRMQPDDVLGKCSCIRVAANPVRHLLAGIAYLQFGCECHACTCACTMDAGACLPSAATGRAGVECAALLAFANGAVCGVLQRHNDTTDACRAESMRARGDRFIPQTIVLTSQTCCMVARHAGMQTYCVGMRRMHTRTPTGGKGHRVEQHGASPPSSEPHLCHEGAAEAEALLRRR